MISPKVGFAIIAGIKSMFRGPHPALNVRPSPNLPTASNARESAVPARAISAPASGLGMLRGRLDLAGVEAFQDDDLGADAWDIAEGPDREVRITFDSWQHFEPDLPTPKKLGDRFYNEMAPVHVVRVLSSTWKLAILRKGRSNYGRPWTSRITGANKLRKRGRLPSC
jgi:hypothetical protein